MKPDHSPFFSVVVPLFKAESTIRQAIESLQSQTFGDWEAVFVDDGSPDDSSAIVERAARSDPRLRLVRSGENRGTHKARKTGVDAARGEWILFLDPDDAFATDAFSSLARRLSRSGVDLVRSDFSPMDPSLCSPDQLRSFERNRVRDRSWEGDGVALDILFSGSGVQFFVCTFAVRSSVAKRAFSLTEDGRLVYSEGVYEVFALASLSRGYAENPDRVYLYRVGTGGQTSWRHALGTDSRKWLDGFERTLGQRADSFAAMARFGDRSGRFPAFGRRVRSAIRRERRRQLVGVFPWELSVARSLGCPSSRLRGCLRSLLSPLSLPDRIVLRTAWFLRRMLEPLGLLSRPRFATPPRNGFRQLLRRRWRRFLERRRLGLYTRRRERMLRESAPVETEIAAGRFSSGPLPRLFVYTLCRNEHDMIPWFVAHYARYAEKIVVYDNESTDDSVELLRARSPTVEVRTFSTGGLLDDFATMRLRNAIWKEARGTADLVLVVDMDEFLWHPRMEDFLRAFASGGWTVLAPCGAQMVSETFPVWAPGLQLVRVLRCGVIPRIGSKSFRQRSKWCLLDPNAIDDMGWGPGNHAARPRGRVRILASDEVKLLHYDYIGRDRIFDKMRANRDRMSAEARKAGLAGHYFAPEADRLAWFESLLKRAKPVV